MALLDFSEFAVSEPPVIARNDRVDAPIPRARPTPIAASGGLDFTAQASDIAPTIPTPRPSPIRASMGERFDTAFSSPLEPGERGSLDVLREAVLGKSVREEEIPGILEAAQKGIARAGKDFQQSRGAGRGALPEQFEHDTGPETEAIAWSDLKDIKRLTSKMGYHMAHGAPMLLAGTVATAFGGIGGGAVAAGAATAFQAIGPYYAEAIAQGAKPDEAFQTALSRAGKEGVLSGAAWAAFGIMPFQGFMKNLLLQAFVVQPAVVSTGTAAINVSEGRDPAEGIKEQIPGTVIMTAGPFAAIHGARVVGGKARTIARGRKGAPDFAAQATDAAPTGPARVQVTGWGEGRVEPTAASVAENLRGLPGRTEVTVDGETARVPGQRDIPSEAVPAETLYPAPREEAAPAAPATRAVRAPAREEAVEDLAARSSPEVQKIIREATPGEQQAIAEAYQRAQDAGVYQRDMESEFPRTKRQLDELLEAGKPLWRSGTEPAEGQPREMAQSTRPADVKYREEVERITAELPPVPEGMTRLYRGNREGEVGENPSFTSDLAGIALPFKNAYGGRLSYVDVPTRDLPTYRRGRGASTDAEFTVPPEIARQAKVAEADRGARTAPAKVETPEDLAVASRRVTPEPSKAQIEAGNYAKGHIKFQGLDITIENPKGGMRRGVDRDGKPWEVEMPEAYGYIKRTEGKDGDHVDVYVGEKVDGDRVFVIDQVDARSGRFDEHKAMLGFESEASARAAYERAFSDGKGADRIGNITEMSAAEFKTWIKEGDTTKQIAKQREFASSAVKPPASEAENIAAGREAMERAIADKADVPNAMYRPEVGWISFLWGDRTAGLAHIVRRRGREGMDPAQFLREMPEVIAKGEVGPAYDSYRGSKRRNIDLGDRVAVLALDRFGANEVWVLTAFRRKSASGAPADPDMNPAGLRSEGLSSLPKEGAEASRKVGPDETGGKGGGEVARNTPARFDKIAADRIAGVEKGRKVPAYREPILKPEDRVERRGRYSIVRLPPKEKAALERAVTAKAEKIFGTKVPVSLEDIIPIRPDAPYLAAMRRYQASGGEVGRTAGGITQITPGGQALIRLALQDPKYKPMASARHEAYHVVEALLMREREFAVVSSLREALRIRDFAANELNVAPDVASKLPPYEQRAIAYERYDRMRDEGIPIREFGNLPRPLVAFFEKLRRMAGELRRFFTGRGWSRFEDIFEDVYQGKMANRPKAYRDVAAMKALHGDRAYASSTAREASGLPRRPGEETGRKEPWVTVKELNEILPEMQKAKAPGGWDPGLYFHGTRAKFSEFSSKGVTLWPPSQFKIQPFKPIHWFTNDPAIARRHGGRIYPVRLKMDNPLVVDMQGKQYYAIAGDSGRFIKSSVQERAVDQMVKGGHDSLILRNMRDKGGVQDQFAMFEPKNIRSVWAEFEKPRTAEAKPAETVPAAKPIPKITEKATETPAFKKWFGESKVVDEAGKPLVVYHGTDRVFDSFDPAKRGMATRRPDTKHGFFFTTNRKLARWFANNAKNEAIDRWETGSTERVMPLYLKIENPLRVDATGKDWTITARNIRVAKRRGHDGVIFRGFAAGGEAYGKNGVDTFVVFDPKQIKSAWGNRGTFDPSDARIFASSVPHAEEVTPFAKRGAEARQRTMNAQLGGLQPVDRAFRIPFQIFGGLNKKGEWKPGLYLTKKTGELLTSAKFAEDGRFAFMNPVLHKARAGLIDRYGLSRDYVEREFQRGLEERKIMAEVPELMTVLRDANVGTQEAKALHGILTGERMPDGEWSKISEPIRKSIDDLGQEAVNLGLLDAATFERNRGAYLHRAYLKHEADQGNLAGWVNKMMGARRQKILGEQFKGRGMWQEVTPNAVTRASPEAVAWRKGNKEIKALEARIDTLTARRDVAAERLSERRSEMGAQLDRRGGTHDAARNEKGALRPGSYQKGQAREQGVSLGRLRDKGNQAHDLIARLDAQIAQAKDRIAKLETRAPAAVPEQGAKFRILDQVNEAGKATKRVYLPAGEKVPAELEGYKDRGVWEIRGKKGNRLVLWRDFTKEERTKMGEIIDARYTIAKTYMLMAHDIATGRFYRDVSKNADWARADEPPAGQWKDASEYGRFWTDASIEWVKVPNTIIPKTKARRYGDLSGKYVRAEIWRDLHELDVMQRGGFWNSLLREWKINKTARSPVVHMNNVMANFVLMDMADVRAVDLARAVRSLKNGDAIYKEAVDNGAFGVDMVAQEIRQNVLRPILEEIEKSGRIPETPQAKLRLLDKIEAKVWGGSAARGAMYGGVAGASIGGPAGILPGMAIGAAGGALLGRATAKFDRSMVSLYQVEDELFRMATYMRRRSQGASPRDAAVEARDQFVNYDIRAPWVNAARRSVLPFISYTYRAAPLLARTVMTRPWKIAKYAALAYGANALAYELMPGDEERERNSMREQEQGNVWFGAPRMVRLPFGDEHGNPMFIDVRRWVPSGDVFDLNQGQSGLPIPAPLQFGGPLMMGMELFLNKQAFTGKEIHNELTDDWWDQASKTGDWAWKSWMPSAAWVPGSWYWNKIMNAVSGARDYEGRPYSVPQAALSSIGIKVKPQDVEAGFELRAMEFDKVERDLKAQMSRLGRDRERGLISAREYERRREKLIEKMGRLDDNRRDVFESSSHSRPAAQ